MKLYEKIIWVFVGVIFGIIIIEILRFGDYNRMFGVLSIFILLLSVRFLKNKEYKLFSFVTFVVVWLLIVVIDENIEWLYFFIILPITWITMRLFRVKFYF